MEVSHISTTYWNEARPDNMPIEYQSVLAAILFKGSYYTSIVFFLSGKWWLEGVNLPLLEREEVKYWAYHAMPPPALEEWSVSHLPQCDVKGLYSTSEGKFVNGIKRD